MKNYWTKEECEKFYSLCDKHLPKKEIALQMGRTVSAIESKLYKDRKNKEVRLQPSSFCKWTAEDEELLSTMWGENRTVEEMMTKLHRSKKSISAKSTKMHLGRRTTHGTFMALTMVAEEMGVSCDTVHRWIMAKKLKCHRMKYGPMYYGITESQLLKFLQEYPDLYDASKISQYLIAREPEWLKQKRVHDKVNKRDNRWTSYDDIQLAKLLQRGFTYKEIGERINRTTTACRKRAAKVGIAKYNKHKWTMSEIRIINHNIDADISYLCKLIPTKTRPAIRMKRLELKRMENTNATVKCGTNP
jgi:hypothetical protein